MITVVREKEQTTQTKGALTFGIFICPTLELAWKDNKKVISCIPIGTYTWRKRERTKNIPYTHILIENVQNRDGICIHAANYASGNKVQLKGCIAVGSGYADIDKDGNEDIINSKLTFEKLMSLLPVSGEITIKNK